MRGITPIPTFLPRGGRGKIASRLRGNDDGMGGVKATRFSTGLRSVQNAMWARVRKRHQGCFFEWAASGEPWGFAPLKRWGLSATRVMSMYLITGISAL